MLHIEIVYATTPLRHTPLRATAPYFHHAIVFRSCTCLNYHICLTIFRTQYSIVVKVKPQQWTGHNCGFRCKFPLVAPPKDTFPAALRSYKLSFFNRRHSKNFYKILTAIFAFSITTHPLTL